MGNIIKEHWDSIYSSKKLEEVSWYQPVPQTSLDFILSSNISKDAPIIDIGGGDSFLVDYLLDHNFTDITVLDVSNIAVNRAKSRLGDKAKKINWIVLNIKDFNPDREYAIWHDRAVFHFMREKIDVQQYHKISSKSVKNDGKLILGTFSENGPERCCSLDVKRYSTMELCDLFSDTFTARKTLNTIHKTPWGKEQAFSFVELIKNKLK